MFYFTVTRPANANFTPADLIIGYAKTRNYKISYYYDMTKITIAGIDYVYDHWKIFKNNETQKINVYLKRVKK